MVKGRVDGWFGFDFLLKYVCYGLWLSLVERSVRDREVAGSNPVNPTMKLQARGLVPLAFSFVRYLCAEPNGRSLATIGCACPLRLRARRDWSCVLETVVRLDRGSYR